MDKQYGIEFRNMHTAIHGILLFNTYEKAIENIEKLQFANGEEGSEYYDELICEVYQESDGILEEINYRDITPRRQYIIEDELLVFIVNLLSIDIY